MNILDVQKLNIAFEGKRVVRDVSFTIAPGEKLALVGESGSGKSVTAMSLLGLTPQASVSGTATFAGRNLITLPQPALQGVRGSDIAVIFQEPMTALNPVYSVGYQIAEVLRIKRGMDRRQAWQQAVAKLHETGIPDPERRAHAYPHQLSGGQRQRAMIAMALACEPKLLLADEPTTALDVTLRIQILNLLADLQKKNDMAVLLITHDLNMVRRFADRVAVMEKGVLVEQAATHALFNFARHPYTRKLIASRPQRDVTAPAPRPPPGTAPLLAADAVRVGYRLSQAGIRNWFRKQEFIAVKGAAFTLGRGQTLAIIGESGSGKTTLAHAALGLVRHGGILNIEGQSWQQARAQGRLASKSLRRKVQVVFQDPYSSLSPRMTVEQLVGEGLGFHEPDLSWQARRARIIETLADVGLTETLFPNLLGRFAHAFSGGQRQRLAIARALIVRPQVLVLDEPTSALDVTIQKQVLVLLQTLQKRHGLSYFLITHDMDVVHAMAHHVLVMKDGEVVESGRVEDILEQPRHLYTQRLIAATEGYTRLLAAA